MQGGPSPAANGRGANLAIIQKEVVRNPQGAVRGDGCQADADGREQDDPHAAARITLLVSAPAPTPHGAGAAAVSADENDVGLPSQLLPPFPKLLCEIFSRPTRFVKERGTGMALILLIATRAARHALYTSVP